MNINYKSKYIKYKKKYINLKKQLGGYEFIIGELYYMYPELGESPSDYNKIDKFIYMGKFDLIAGIEFF